ncbi:MAG: small multi-drug export protein [Clostridia bacterium]|nr:small multi-drug export protein [Clostridia bacterium]
MAEFIREFLSIFTNDGKIITLLVSMFPLVELKGAIPIGVSYGENLITSALLAYSGSTLVSIPLFFLLLPVFNLLKKIPFIKKVVEKMELVFKQKAEKLAKNSNGEVEEKKRKMLIVGLFIFVAVPFPVTGVWTGTAIAVFLNMKFKDAFLPIVVGNLVAGSIITLLTFLLEPYVDYIILTLFAIAIVMLTIFIIKIIKAKPEQTN